MWIIKSYLRKSRKYIVGFFKWILVGLAMGLAGGLVGALFYRAIEAATELRLAAAWLMWLLPVGGLAIVFLHSISHVALDTNIVIRAIRERAKVSPLMIPLIFISSVISHLFGASVGREGAALQIGGAMGYNFGKLCRMDAPDTHVTVMCGMAAVFAAVFGTPVTAVFFSLEVASVGIMYYAGLLPSLVAAFTAAAISGSFGMRAFDFAPVYMPELSLSTILLAAVLGIAIALLAIIFCILLHGFEHLACWLVKNPYLRIAAGGAVMALFTLVWGSQEYSGAGTDLITAAVRGYAQPWDFALKLVLTVLCVGVGYKGGEIVPTLCIGACFGCLLGDALGLGPAFGAALGMVALFCAVINCPVASIILSVELFGAGGMPYFVTACAVSYMLSGVFSLYRTQTVIYSKVKAQFTLRGQKTAGVPAPDKDE